MPPPCAISVGVRRASAPRSAAWSLALPPPPARAVTPPFPRAATATQAQLPPFDEYDMRGAAFDGSAGRTFRFLDRPPLLSFGHGLSYTTFAVGALRAAPATAAAAAAAATASEDDSGASSAAQRVCVHTSGRLSAAAS